MANCIKDKSQIECEKRLEELTKKWKKMDFILTF